MIETDQYLVQKVITDATLISLMGITVQDKRIYAWYPAMDIVYESSYPCAIAYRKTVRGRGGEWSYPNQFPNIAYYLRTLSINQLVLGQVAERLIDVFDETYLDTTTSWLIGKISINSVTDAPTEGDAGNPIFVKVVSFSFSNIFKRT
jgi:hypothetical protein